jgi:hypothetical protein
MERLLDQAWTTSVQQARLGVQNVAYVGSGRSSLQQPFPEAVSSDPLQPGDTLEYRPEALAWEAALLAQSSAYLALELQAFAERLSSMPIRCPESTYRRLFNSLVTFRHLVSARARSYKETNANGSDGLVPVISERLEREIRSMLVRELVSGSGGSTISTANLVTKHTGDVGATK